MAVVVTALQPPGLSLLLVQSGLLMLQEGLRTLLTRHALSSATLDDLLLALLDGFATTANTTQSGDLFPESVYYSVLQD